LKRIISLSLCAIISFCCSFFGIWGSLDKYAEDMLFHDPSTTDGRIRIIKIDEKTLNEYGEHTQWDRGLYAKLVETLCVSDSIRPAVIGFDILFSNEKNAASDEAFAKACEAHGNVVCAFSYVFSKELITDINGELIEDTLHVQNVVKPYPALEKTTVQGFANALMDNDDGVIRSSFLYFDENGTRAPSFSTAVYSAYAKSKGDAVKLPVDENVFTFRYSGNISEYENVSMCDVLDGTVPPHAFDDCIVLVGAYAAGMMDAYYVPVNRGQQMYGVEIHANVIQAIMEDKTLENVPSWLDGLCSAILACLLMLVCERLGVVYAVVVCLSAAVLRVFAGKLLFSAGYSGGVLEFPLVAALVAAYSIVLYYYKANAAKRKIEKAFNKYVAPQVVNEIAKNGTYELKLGGENRDIAVMFVDIRGFTPLSESLEPEQVVEILNSYLELTTSCIFSHGGTLDKFIGDATMAVFNAPFDTEDYVYKAVLTAWDIARGGDEIEKKFSERFGKQVGFGVGVNCGPAVVGNIGCDFRMDYTAIGDTVNTAARLESNAPRGKIYISSEVYERLKGRITAEMVGEIPLKGKSNGICVYSVTGVTESAEQ